MRLRISKAAGCRSSSIPRADRSSTRRPWANSYETRGSRSPSPGRLIADCPEISPKCPDGPGRAITGGAICASACVLVLAGGVERLAGPVPLIGVHQITTLVKEVEGLAHLKSMRKIYEQRGVDSAVEAYLAAMGVGDPVMTLMRKTPAASIRWLSLAELKASRLATLALDPADPVLDQRRERPQRQSVRRRSAAPRSHRGERRATGPGSRRDDRNRVPLSPRRRRGRVRKRTSADLSRRRRRCPWA